MKRATCVQVLGLLALLFGSYRTSAQFVFLTDNRYVGVAAITNGVLANGQTNYPSTAFANLNGAPSAGADLPGGGSISCSASQTSQLMSNAIFVTNSVSESYNFTGAPPTGFDFTSGESSFQVTFSVQTPTLINLTGFLANNSNPGAPVPPATLTSTHHGTIATAPGVSDFASTNWSYSGILQPDTYELTAGEGFEYFAELGIGEGLWQSTTALVAVPSPQITALDVTNNTLQLTVSAPRGSTNRVLVTTNLANPLSEWQPISTNVADASGVFHVTNSIPPGQNTGFYLISSP